MKYKYLLGLINCFIFLNCDKNCPKDSYLNPPSEEMRAFFPYQEGEIRRFKNKANGSIYELVCIERYGYKWAEPVSHTDGFYDDPKTQLFYHDERMTFHFDLNLNDINFSKIKSGINHGGGNKRWDLEFILSYNQDTTFSCMQYSYAFFVWINQLYSMSILIWRSI